MTIYCKDREEFLDTILGLVKRGLTFVARSDSLIINLSGGF